VIAGGTQLLTGANGYTGTTTINAGATLQIGNSSTTGTLGSGAVTNNGTLIFNRSNAMTVANDISGSGNLTQAGTDTVTLSADNSYGTTTINSGATLQIGNASTTGTLGSGAVTNNGTLIFDRSNAMTVANDISGSGGLTQAGANTLTLTGSNSYGTTTINAGATLQIGSGLSDSTTGTLGTGTVTNNGTVTFNRSNAMMVANTINGSGAVNQSGSGSTTLSGSNGYTGLTTVSAGTLVVINDSALGGTGTGTTVSGGTLDLQANIGAEPITLSGGALQTTTGTGAISGTITLSSASTITVNGALTLSGVISGSNNLTKAGSGTLNLTGANDYVGSTTINAGTVTVSGSGTLGATTNHLTMSSTAILDLQKGLTVGNLVMASGNTITNSTGTSTLTVGGTASLAGTITTSGDQTYTGATTLLANTNLISNNGSGNGTIAFSSTVDSNTDTNYSLTTTTGTGSTTFASTVGATQALLSLTTSGDTSLGGSVTTTGVQSYGGEASITGDATLQTTNSDISFNSNLVLSASLTVNAGTANVTILGNISKGSGSVASQAAYEAEVLSSSPLVFIPLTDAINSSGATNLGTLGGNGTYFIESSEGGPGRTAGLFADTTALYVPGSSYLTYPNQSALNPGSGSFTMVAWVKNNAGGNGMIINKENQYEIAIQHNRIEWAIANSSPGWAWIDANSYLPATGSWTQVVLTSNGSQLNVYANGTAIQTNFPISGSVATGDSTSLMVGNRPSHPQYFNGGISNVAYYDTALTPANVLSQYRAATSGVTVTANLSVTSASLNVAGSVSNVAALSVTTTSSSSSISGVISGTGSVTKAGSGIVTLSNSNTYTGSTTVSAGTLNITGTLSDSTAVTVASGATYIVNSSDTVASLAGAGNTVLNANLTFGDANDTTISGILSGPGSIIKAGAGTLILSGTNTYGGGTTINAGTLTLAANDVLYNTGAVTVAGGTLDIASYSDTVGALTVSSGSITGTTGGLNASSYSVTNSSGTVTISANLLGGGALTKTGAGTLILSGTNTYGGGTYINTSRIHLGSSNALGSGALYSNGGSISMDISNSIRLSSLIVNRDANNSGAITLMSDISTSGVQTYNGSLIVGYNGTVSLTSSNSNITFNGTITAGANSKSNQRSLSIDAGSGLVAFNERVGSDLGLYANFNSNDTNLYVLTVTARRIEIYADVMTFENQTYNGAVYIGDNGTNGLMRTLISVDPSITFNGTLDDLALNTHALEVKAIAVNTSIVPTLSFNGDIGGEAAFASFNAFTGTQISTPGSMTGDISPNSASFNGTITIRGDVTTSGNQSYTANNIVFGSVGSSQQQIFTTTDNGNLDFNVGASPNAISIDNLSLNHSLIIDLGRGQLGASSEASLNASGINWDQITPPSIVMDMLANLRSQKLLNPSEIGIQSIVADVDIGEIEDAKDSIIKCQAESEDLCEPTI
jgi:autotransporter-associated beta strand protein